MTTPITQSVAKQHRLDAYYEALRLQQPRKYGQYLRRQQEALASDRFFASEAGQAVLAEVEAFVTPEQVLTGIEARVGAPHRNEYDLLGIENGATKREIKNAYRRQARKVHPDKGGDEAAFKVLYAAYRQLLTITKD
ncbi:MAG: J domain-containing protein [Ktedonobacterales bacterium]|nr:J domain-containing protein [Ktedonobacterales bacterium]